MFGIISSIWFEREPSGVGAIDLAGGHWTLGIVSFGEVLKLTIQQGEPPLLLTQRDGF